MVTRRPSLFSQEAQSWSSKGLITQLKFLLDKKYVYSIIRALRGLPDASFVWLSIRECFLLGDCFDLCSHHFVSVTVSVWWCCQLEVLLLSRYKALTALSWRRRLEGGRVDCILYCFSFKAFVEHWILFAFEFWFHFNVHRVRYTHLYVQLKDFVPVYMPSNYCPDQDTEYFYHFAPSPVMEVPIMELGGFFLFVCLFCSYPIH